MASAITRSIHLTWLLFVVVLLLLASLIVTFSVVQLYHRESKDAQAAIQRANVNQVNLAATVKCLSDWSIAFGKQQAYVQQLTEERVGALDELARAVLPPTTPERVQAATQTYMRASAAYTAGLKAHPVPQAPTIQCHITAFVPPQPAPTVTVTHTVSGPTRTATIIRTVPGPVSTVTRTIVVPCHGKHC